MKKILLTILLVVTPVLVTPAVGDDEGRQLYGSCIACHGDQGQGSVALNAPALAGQGAAYLARQLNHFALGVRGGNGDTLGMQMRPMAAILGSDAEVEAVANYLAGLPVTPRNGDKPEGDLRNGENQYNAACGACHGGQAQGNPSLNSPRLAGLDVAYLTRQYQNFAAGIRGSHPDDRLGMQMKMMSTVLTSDKDVNDVMLFIASQGE